MLKERLEPLFRALAVAPRSCAVRATYPDAVTRTVGTLTFVQTWDVQNRLARFSGDDLRFPPGFTWSAATSAYHVERACAATLEQDQCR